MIVTLTGTGTSHGIPVIGCECPVCRSTDPHDMRLRCSAYVQAGDTTLVIDTGPEFRLQALKYNIKHLDAVLLTHSHADHLNGLDDLRIFSHTASADKNNETKTALPIYANMSTVDDIHCRFAYIYGETQQGGGKPLLNVVEAENFTRENPVLVRRINEETDKKVPEGTGELLCFPVPMKHGKLDVAGWNIREKDAPETASFSYLTDCSFVPDESIALIQGTEHLVIDGLRERPHQTHFSFEQALDCAAKIHPKNVWLTHICHNNSHEQINAWLLQHKKQFPALKGIPVHAAYDGLTLTI